MIDIDALTLNADKAEIYAELMRWLAAFRRRDMDGIMAGRADDIVAFDVPPPFQFTSAKAYRKNLEDCMATMAVLSTLDMDEIRIVAAHDVAFCHFVLHIAGKNLDGDPFDCTTRATFGLEKINGAWCVVHEHHSMPMHIGEAG